MAEVNKVDNVAKASIAKINDVPVANIEAINQTPWTALPQPFVMEIDSTNLTAQTMTLGLTSTGTYDFDVDWGDGSPVTTITVYNSPDATHVYSASQKYTITLQPNTATGIRGYDFNNVISVRTAYTEIISWGDVYIDLSQSIFQNVNQLNWNTSTAGIPNFISKVMISSQFRDADSLTADLSGWGTISSPIAGTAQSLFQLANPASSPNANFVGQFTSCLNAFRDSTYNAPLDNWDVSSVTDFTACFYNATLFNQNINSWNTSSATSIRQMFFNAERFNQPLNSWNTSNVTTMAQMFQNCDDFNQNIGSWNTGNVTNMASMFLSALSFNQPIGTWDVSSVTTMVQMFMNSGVGAINLNAWNTSNVTDMHRMFRICSFSGNIDSWNVSSVTRMSEMFLNSTTFRGTLGSWNTVSLTNMQSTFQGTSNNPNLDLRNWDVSNVVNFFGAFQFSSGYSFPLNLWQVYSATNMTQMVGTNASFTDQQCEDAFVAWSNDPLTATNVNATNIWGGRTYPIGGAMETATIKLTGATYNWTVTGLTFV